MRTHRIPLEAANRDYSTWSRKCLLGIETAYAHHNFKPRYHHNPAHWLGGNRDRDGNVLNCHRSKHFGMPGKSTLNRRLSLNATPASRGYKRHRLSRHPNNALLKILSGGPYAFTHQDSRLYLLSTTEGCQRARESTGPRTLWYLACTERITANHREHE
jgi:hypothetical protein